LLKEILVEASRSVSMCDEASTGLSTGDGSDPAVSKKFSQMGAMLLRIYFMFALLRQSWQPLFIPGSFVM